MLQENHDRESLVDDERALNRGVENNVVEITAGIVLALDQVHTMQISSGTDFVDSMD